MDSHMRLPSSCLHLTLPIEYQGKKILGLISFLQVSLCWPFPGTDLFIIKFFQPSDIPKAAIAELQTCFTTSPSCIS